MVLGLVLLLFSTPKYSLLVYTVVLNPELPSAALE